MPAAGLKEKTKRTADRPPFEKSTTKHADSDEDIDMDEDMTSEEEDVPEKDEAEKKLERMLFGDDEGFMGALKSQQERADAMQLALHSDEESESADEEAEGEDEDMENVADSDVCCHVMTMLAIPILKPASLTVSTFDSFSSLIPGPRPALWTSCRHQVHHPMPRIPKRTPLPLFGTTAMMSGSLSRWRARPSCGNCVWPSRRM